MKVPSRIYIDGGDPTETGQADALLKAAGHAGVEGQTTNPTLVSKNPDVVKYLAAGKKLTHEEALGEYKKIVTAIARITSGPISIQVLADGTTSKEEMLAQAYVYKDWIPNGVVKFPCTGNGLAAAEVFCRVWSVNITLNFTQEQAAAVYAATLKHTAGVFVSPFIGRLDDRGENGMQVVENELKMYRTVDNHVIVLTASLRKLDHLLYAFALGSPVVTVPFKIVREWSGRGFPLPDESYAYDPGSSIPIPYREIPLGKDWREYDLAHPLTDAGLTKFMDDWRSIIK